MTTCQVPKCRKPVALWYYRKGACAKCWERHCEEKINLKILLNIKEKSYGNKNNSEGNF
jgi:hypothetical protein